MLKKYYDSIYIPKENDKILTGKFSYMYKSGILLHDVEIIEEDGQIIIHGYRRKFEYNCNDGFHYCMTEDDWETICTEPTDFRITEPGIVKKIFTLQKAKPVKYLKSGWYTKKKNPEYSITFSKENMLPEIHKK